MSSGVLMLRGRSVTSASPAWIELEVHRGLEALRHERAEIGHPAAHADVHVARHVGGDHQMGREADDGDGRGDDPLPHFLPARRGHEKPDHARQQQGDDLQPDVLHPEAPEPLPGDAAHRRAIEMLLQLSLRRDGDRSILLGDDDDQRIALLAETDCREVPRAMGQPPLGIAWPAAERCSRPRGGSRG